MERYDRPYICSETSWFKEKVPDAALDFLSTESVPSEFRPSWNALLNLFQFNKASNYSKFEELVNLICYRQGPNQKSPEYSEIVDRINYLLGENLSNRTLRLYFNSLFSILVSHLGMEGKINLPPTPVFCGRRSENILSTSWFKKLPSEFQFWLVVGDYKLFQKYACILDKRLVEAAKNCAASKQKMSASSILMRHYFCFGAKDSFEIDAFAKVYKTVCLLSAGNLSRDPILSIYSEVLEKNIASELRELSDNLTFSIGDISQVYQQEILQMREASGVSDPKDFSRHAASVGVSGYQNRKKAGSNALKLPVTFDTEFGLVHKNKAGKNPPDGYMLYVLRDKEEVSFGGFVLTKNALKRFLPGKLYNIYPESLWLAHQKDWIDLKQGEKYTRKHQAIVLRYFNAYIFSYLPWYKENIDPEFSIPTCIEEFNPNFFVRHTASFQLRHNSDVPLPVTFPEFLEKASALTATKNDNSNTLKQNQNLTVQYFDHYIELEGLEVNNPLKLMAKARGYAYGEVQKQKADYEYWWLLKEFLFGFSRCCLMAYKDMIIEGDRSRSNWCRLFEKYAKDCRPSFGNVTLDMSKLSDLDDVNHETIHVFSIMLCLLAQSGLRLTNVYWLDARNFDSLVPDQFKEKSHLKLFVNTDKARLRPYASHVKVEVIELMRELSTVRGMVFSDEAVFYQGNKESKWKKIVPLFRYQADSHSEHIDGLVQEAITVIIKAFETLLRHTGHSFETTLYPKVNGITYDDFLLYKATRTQAPFKEFVLEKEAYYSGTDSKVRPVSIFQYRSYLTSHSFRVTFDSFWSNIISNETISKLHTGQTPQTVGYYSKNTPDDVNQAIKISQHLGLPNQIQNQDKDAQKTIKGLKENGITSDIIAISAGSVDEFDLDEEIRRAPDQNIAVNRTHICPYGNVCPKKIKTILDNKKLCGLCPASLSFKSDGPAIAAEIRRLGDEIADLSVAIDSGELTDGEKASYSQRRMSLTTELSAWMCRHDYLIEMSDGEILLDEDGQGHYERKLTYQIPNETWTDDQETLWRILETSEVKTLQSERLRAKARRVGRTLVTRITPDIMDAIESDPVKAAALTVKKYARLQGLSLDEVVEHLETVSEETSVTPLLQSLTGNTTDV